MARRKKPRVEVAAIVTLTAQQIDLFKRNDGEILALLRTFKERCNATVVEIRDSAGNTVATLQ